MPKMSISDLFDKSDGITNPAAFYGNQVAFDQRDLYSTFEFERAMDRHCQPLVSKLDTSHSIKKKLVKSPCREF